jgi:2-polyprenyl-6-methoxyphenol hydroxylase-like FAD-dependent oxidoreductase
VPPSTIEGVKTDICIRGAGVVGQVLALLLARARICSCLFAQETVLRPDLRSFALSAASRKVLMDLRAWPELAMPVRHMQVFGDTTGHVSFDAQAQPLAWIVDASVLQERLTSAISFAPEITRVTDPATLPLAELTVICEGRLSQTREAAGIEFEQFAYAQSAIAAHVISEKPHQSTAWQWMQGGDICALLPRESAESGTGGNSAALVWSVSQERAQELLALSSADFVKALEQATQGALGSLQLSSERASWPLVVAQAKQWSGVAPWGAWVLAGDAAHAVHPLAGQGLNLGLGDAVALAQAMAGKPYFRSFGDAKLLRSYERARKGDAAMMRLATDGLQRMFSAQDARLQSLRNWGMQSVDAAAPLKAWLMRQASGLR